MHGVVEEYEGDGVERKRGMNETGLGDEEATRNEEKEGEGKESIVPDEQKRISDP